MASSNYSLKRQQALAEFGDFVLDNEGLDEVLQESCRLIASALGVDFAKVIEIFPGKEVGFVRAGVGWRPGVVGHEHVNLTDRSSEAFAVQMAQPVICNDITRETRFTFAPFLSDHGVVALVNVPILLPGRVPWGVLEVDARELREFGQDDVDFLKTYAMALGPVIDRARAVAGREAARSKLAESEESLRTLIQGMPQLVWRATGEGWWTWASPQWRALTSQKKHEGLGQGWLQAVHPDDRQAARASWHEAIQRADFSAEYRIYAAKEGRYRWFQTRAAPVRNETGTIVEWLGTSTDIEDLRQLQERQQVLVAELQHRTFNLMSLVRSIADATMRSSDTLADFKPKFRDRIAALARTQRLLSRLSDDDRVSFETLLLGELDAVGALTDEHRRVTFAGPDNIALRSSTVQILAMVLHELATNAVKYGALGQHDAKLAISWKLEAEGSEEPWLRIDWIETGVVMPVTEQSLRGTGQGRALIENALPHQLNAKTKYVLGSEGVCCFIKIPVSSYERIEVTHAT
ncbi:PAS domain-containing protein [Sphingomonas sp. SAFR-052]|uniref:PAS domain-containing protein n=1 Tax=Sphingomonas sp. SAFR-052 TaxID=3436867 RepID=UPI003F7DD2A2